MADFEFTVDTSEMAQSIRGVSTHVSGVSTAVVTMQGAIIAAEEAAAASVCENVDRGFYSLIRSQISQKIAALQSKVDARIMEMRQQALSVARVRATMERDFAAVSARYTKLFGAIDASLRSRVFELDRAAVTLRQREYGFAGARASRMQAAVPLNQLESIQAHQSIGVARARANAMRAIESMQRFVLDASVQRRTFGRMLAGTRRSMDRRSLTIPVIVVESDSLRGAESRWAYRFASPPASDTASRLEREIAAQVFGGIANGAWIDVDPTVRLFIDAAFRRKVDGAPLADRVRTELLRLAGRAAWTRPAAPVT